MHAKHGHEIEQEAQRLEEASMADLGAHLTDLESSWPEGHVRDWLADLSRNAVPVRFNPETGAIEEVH